MHKRYRLGCPVLLLSGCVFPQDIATGVELSWFFHEVDQSDGADERRVLTCAGAEIDGIAVEVSELNATDRHGQFEFSCEAGYQTPEQSLSDSTDAFISLRSGTYVVSLFATGATKNDALLTERTIELDQDKPTVETWELARPPIDWNLQISNSEACDILALALVYADPQTSLAENELQDQAFIDDPVYRQQLVSNRELRLGGAPQACDGIGGAHLFSGIDRGSYTLRIYTDGTQCEIPLDLGPGSSTTLDLAALPCHG